MDGGKCPVGVITAMEAEQLKKNLLHFTYSDLTYSDLTYSIPWLK